MLTQMLSAAGAAASAAAPVFTNELKCERTSIAIAIRISSFYKLFVKFLLKLNVFQVRQAW